MKKKYKYKKKIWIVVWASNRDLVKIDNKKDRKVLKNLEKLSIFNSKKDAMNWVKQWKNSEDFDCFRSEIQIPLI